MPPDRGPGRAPTVLLREPIPRREHTLARARANRGQWRAPHQRLVDDSVAGPDSKLASEARSHSPARPRLLASRRPRSARNVQIRSRIPAASAPGLGSGATTRPGTPPLATASGNSARPPRHPDRRDEHVPSSLASTDVLLGSRPHSVIPGKRRFTFQQTVRLNSQGSSGGLDAADLGGAPNRDVLSLLSLPKVVTIPQAVRSIETTYKLALRGGLVVQQKGGSGGESEVAI